jgi:hypothetical protein
MRNPVDHVTMVDVDPAGTANAAVPAVRHTATDVTPIAPIAPLIKSDALAKSRNSQRNSAHTVDRFHAGAGLTLAALGALLYTLSLDCGDELEAFLALIVGTGGAALTMWAVIPGLTVLEPAGRAVFAVLRPICWLATIAPRRALATTWLLLVASAAVAIARNGAAPC